MTGTADLPAWAAWATAIFLLLGAGITLTGAIGLLRLRNFYERVHSPTLGTSLGTGGILAASVIYFSVLESRPVVHEILIGIFVLVTTPVTLMLLVQAARQRDRFESQDDNQATGAEDGNDG